MGPRADFSCLSKKCQQDGAATVYQDLPINTTRCPVCGSKRIVRLYNHVNVSHGVAPHIDRVMQTELTKAQDQKNSVRAGEAHQRAVADRIEHALPQMSYDERDKWAEQNMRIHALPMGQAARQYVGTQAAGKATPPGLQAGAPIPWSGNAAHQVQPATSTMLRDMTKIEGVATVKP